MSNTIAPNERINNPSGKNRPSRFGAGGGEGGGTGYGAEPCSIGTVAFDGSGTGGGGKDWPKFGSSNACGPAGSAGSSGGSIPSGTGTMISPAHFGQRTTCPALRRAIPIN